ncbi:dihydrodipicolinate synthase family protein [Melghirimyces profundicolus]|nr:dihydrodipicolinate synthase family protein [Melghirimyces profundicolus]
MKAPALPAKVQQALQDGAVIPAHPLALDADRRLDEGRQRGLTRYYLDSGAGGIAVGVHTTQFAIRHPDVDLLETVLKLAAEETRRWGCKRPVILVAGICGPTEQAVREAELARRLGYHLGLLSMGGLDGWDEEALLERARRVGEVIPLFGFYLQPAVGGRVLSFDFWRELAENRALQAIKIAPFDRYRTLDVVRAVCHSSRRNQIALYTGNDDNIVPDLLTVYRFRVKGETVEKRIVGGLLGQWAVWTHRAVKLLDRIKKLRETGEPVPLDLLTLGGELTDANAAIFDSIHHFRGCLPGIHEVLRRQGFLEGRWCLDPDEELSTGQREEIERVIRDYPYLSDDGFVRSRIHSWLS